MPEVSENVNTPHAHPTPSNDINVPILLHTLIPVWMI